MNRSFHLTISVSVFLLLASPLGGFDWPRPEQMKKLPVELIEIPSLADEDFMKQAREVEAAIRSEPTSRENLEHRVDVGRRYYNALQAEGFLLPGIAIAYTNVAQAFSADRGEEVTSYLRGFDNQYLGLRLLHDLHDKYGPMPAGRVETVVSESDFFTARRFTTIKVIYHPTMPLPEGTRFRFAPNWQMDMSPLQLSRPTHMGYTTFRCSNPSVKLVAGMENWHSVFGSLYTPGEPRPVVTVLSGALTLGDQITFTLGDTSGGGPGLLLPSGATDAFNLRFEVNPGDTPTNWIVAGEPRFVVRGEGPHHLRVVAPTTVREDDTFQVQAILEDRYFNRASGGPSVLGLYLEGELISRVGHSENDPAIFHFTGVQLRPDQKGPVLYDVLDAGGEFYGRSNPVHLIGPDEMYVYWGDLHFHEGYTDGTGTAEWVMNYAKNVAFLDFATLTGHDLMMSELYQRDVQRVTEKYHEPGRFVTLKSYEWTQLPSLGGHHNVFYLDPDQRIIPVNEARSLPDLYRLQRQINDPTRVMIIPHCHMPGDWNFHDREMSRLVEVYSMHGRFEWFGKRFLEMGYYMGLIAASDDHTGHPGNNPVRKSQRGGVTAVYSTNLTRKGIFDGLTSRRAYGSTNAHAYLKTDVAGAPMGSVVKRPRPSPPSIEVRGFVSGTAAIARVTAVLNGKEVEELNFLSPPPGRGPGRVVALRVMIKDSNDPGGDGTEVSAPLGRVDWWGRIKLKKSRMTAVIPIGIEGPGDTFRQIHQRKVDFACTVRGDEDGVILELDRWDPQDSLTIELFTAAREVGRHVSSELPLWGELPATPWKTLEIPFAELEKGVQTRAIDERSGVQAELIGSGLKSYREFSFQLTDGVKPEGENYVYVRVQQIDDEMVWSSPVWVQWE